MRSSFLSSVFLLLTSLSRSGSALSFSKNSQVVPGVEHLTPQFFPEHQSKRVKISHGPFTVPEISVDNGMKAFGSRVVPMPCTDCLITWLQADLEYDDGTVADAETGMWLHHTVFSNTNRQSVVCPAMKHGDRFFASGNERTPASISADGTFKAGYYVGLEDNFGMSAEFMNMQDVPRDVVLTVTYEYIPGVPSGFEKAKLMWFDIGGCGSSELPAELDTTFQYSSPTWKSTLDGRITFVGSHLHDGGTHVEITKNRQVVCDSKATYGQPESSSMDMEESHISSMSACHNLGHVSKGDEWSITAYYDTSSHTPMTNMDGSLEGIMGIGLAYVAEHHHHHRGRMVAIVLSCIVGIAVVSTLIWARRRGLTVKDIFNRFRRDGGISLGDSDNRTGLPLLSEEDEQ